MAQADEVSPREAYLTNMEDRDIWFRLFQAMAKAKDVWEYVNPKGTADLTEQSHPNSLISHKLHQSSWNSWNFQKGGRIFRRTAVDIPDVNTSIFPGVDVLVEADTTDML